MEGPDAHEYQAAGRRVRCTHCENTTFVAREALLNTTGMTLLNLDSYPLGAFALGGGDRAFWLALAWNVWSAVDAY